MREERGVEPVRQMVQEDRLVSLVGHGHLVNRAPLQLVLLAMERTRSRNESAPLPTHFVCPW